MKNNLCLTTLAQLIKLDKSNKLNTKQRIKANALLLTPDQNKPISVQINKTTIGNLPDPTILKNKYFEMYTGAAIKPVCAKADNTYCYGVRDPELAAVSVFLALNRQIQIYLSLGLKYPRQPLPVIINNPFVVDNAYFDPKHYQMHIGVGSGVKHDGLTRNIAFDLGVANHEFGHAVVALQTGNGDLPGKEGEAINEAVADVLGALAMDYLSRSWYGEKSGQPFTVADLKNDRRIIGKYALPPFGIRSQKTNKKAPGDICGEPHADGLIVGSALADLLVEIASQPGTEIDKQLRIFIRMTLLALALMPDMQVSFIDLLRSMIIADKKISQGKYHLLIEQCFAKHGITLNTIKNLISISQSLETTK